MEKKNQFTNENLSKKFKSNFELVSYAIKLAENMIRTGRDARVKSDMQNRAMLVLEEIVEGKDQFDEVPEKPVAQASNEAHINGESKKEIFREERVFERRGKSKSFLSEDESE